MLEGRVALVTGAGSGIGASCARALAEAGANVLVLDVNEQAADTVAAAIGGRAVVVDLADLSSVDTAMAGLEPDIVVNNAGVQHLALLHEFPPEQFTRLLDVMLQAPFRIARAALPRMYAQGWGRFVHITSIRGTRGDQRKAAYVAAKHGVEGLSKTIALEGATYGVTSNCISPAWVDTPLTHELATRQAAIRGTTAEAVMRDVMLGGAAIKELIDADEIAALVTHLCSPSARHTTGTSIPIDGGWLAG
ncbi:SDR family oxidoreductase [Pseudonocardia spinosispora]|uniref:SDR family oxidoreductase n=1 Tax=Pseudonocardia spinosispora TaxID=103441 RepID=UPI000402945A|nr:SDR family oxidoreductase [Pseudonocardia spinosispora]